MSKLSGDELLYFSIIKNSLPIFELNFQKDMHDSTLFAGFVTAISYFAKDFSDSDLKIIDQGDIKIGIEEGEEVDIYYIATEITSELRSKIRLILNYFELEYTFEIQKHSIIDTSTFKGFKEHALQTFSKETVKSYYIPFSTNKKITDDPSRFPYTWNFISEIDGMKTISQIAELTGEEMTLIIETLSLLWLDKIIDFKIVVNTFDILFITDRGLRRIFGSTETRQGLILMFGEEFIDLIKELDGKKTVMWCIKETKIDVAEAQEFLSLMIMKGDIKKISKRSETCLSFESSYNLVYNSLKLKGDEKAYSIIKNLIQEEDHMLTNMIILREEKISFYFLHTLMKSDNCNLKASQVFNILAKTLSSIVKNVEGFGKL
jgi:hypothetical protein